MPVLVHVPEPMPESMPVHLPEPMHVPDHVPVCMTAPMPGIVPVMCMCLRICLSVLSCTCAFAYSSLKGSSCCTEHFTETCMRCIIKSGSLRWAQSKSGRFLGLSLRHHTACKSKGIRSIVQIERRYLRMTIQFGVVLCKTKERKQ